MVGTTVMVNGKPVGHVEAVRIETRDDGEHLYEYRLYEDGQVKVFGTLTHLGSDGPYALLYRVFDVVDEIRAAYD